MRKTRLPIRSRLVSQVLSFVLIALTLLLIGCGTEPIRSASTYTVKAGDTLYSIASRHGVDFRELARWNGIGRDYAIRPGQVLRFQSGTSGAGTSRAKASARQLKPVQRNTPVTPVITGPPVKWSWPTRANTVSLTTRPNGGQGFTLAGDLGQEVRAAASGRVVYTGTGLLGYGQLVIIKHNETYLSAYGHTQSVLVREGNEVQSGQAIATMGAGPNGKPALYFEIRVNGQPVDPTPMLPK